MDKSSEILDVGVATSANSTQSSENILHLLNDDCITEIFRQFTNLEDLVNAASTCKRFRECAMSLKYMLRSVTIQRNRHHRYSRKDVISAHVAPLFFKNIGHLVESVEWRLAGNGKREAELFELLAESCGGTLKKLKIFDLNPSFNKPNQFPVLEELILYNEGPKDFRLDAPIKYLEIHNFRHVGVDDLEQPWFVREFPHLESVRFNTTEITDDTLSDFLTLNSQLRALEANSKYLTLAILESVGSILGSIERLQIRNIEYYQYDNSKLHGALLHLSNLKKMSEFGMSGRLSLKMLLEMFAKSNVPIGSLEVDVCATDNGATFPTIESLKKVRCICRSDVDDSCIVNLVKSQPALQVLQIKNIRSNITAESIEKILNFGKNLTDFELSDSCFYFDVESYNRILRLAIRNRVRVTFCQVYAPADILKMNSEWLRILFY